MTEHYAASYVRESWTRDERFRTFLADDGQTGNYRSLATPLVRSKPESLGATLSNLYRDIQIRMVAGYGEVPESKEILVAAARRVPNLQLLSIPFRSELIHCAVIFQGLSKTRAAFAFQIKGFLGRSIRYRS